MRSNFKRRPPPGIAVEFLGDGVIELQGTATGKCYKWSGKGTRLTVDKRDFPGLQKALPMKFRWV